MPRDKHRGIHYHHHFAWLVGGVVVGRRVDLAEDSMVAAVLQVGRRWVEGIVEEDIPVAEEVPAGSSLGWTL